MADQREHQSMRRSDFEHHPHEVPEIDDASIVQAPARHRSKNAAPESTRARRRSWRQDRSACRRRWSSARPCRYRRRKIRIMAQTIPTMAPAQRVVAPDLSSNRQPFIDNEPAKPPVAAASRLAMPLVRNSLSRSAVFCRATSRPETSSSSAIAMTPHTAPISALLCAIAHQSTSLWSTAPIGHHKARLPRLGRNHASRVASGTKPNRLISRTITKAAKMNGSAT